LKGVIAIAADHSISVPIRIKTWIQEFLTEFYYCEIEAIERILPPTPQIMTTMLREL